MPPRSKTYIFVLLALLLFLALAWSLNLTIFNLWASGGPPVEHPEIYRHRANIFFAISVALLVAFLIALWGLIRNRKGHTSAEQVMRKVIAIAAVPGFIAGMCIFIASCFGLTMNKLGTKAFLLHLGIFVLAIPLVIAEQWSKGGSPFGGKPRWVVRSIQILGLLCIALFFVFLALSHVASPEIINGEYVLNNHGKIVGHISERDYLFLKRWELRLFASGWMFAYYSLIMHWWFPRQDPWTVVMPD